MYTVEWQDSLRVRRFNSLEEALAFQATLTEPSEVWQGAWRVR